jgi:hypothetical protein
VIVHDLDVVSIAVSPAEADPPLIVDPDAVLSSTVAAESFQSVPRWYSEILKVHSGIQHPELAQRRVLRGRPEPGCPPPAEQALRVTVAEALDHGR